MACSKLTVFTIIISYLSICKGWAKQSAYPQKTEWDTSRLQNFDWKPRFFIMSDILNEPDDSMSLIRYLLYSNEFDTRGICATTSWWLKNKTHPEEMNRIINAYGEVVENLNQHVNPNSPYDSAEKLLSLVTSGPSVYGRAALHEPLSEGAKRIILALQESQEPLFIAGWGGTNTLAQALLHINNTMSSSDAAELRSRIRLYTISDQDDTGPWIRAHFPDIFYVVSIHAWNAYPLATWSGMTLTGCPCVNSSLAQNPWLDANIRYGPLGSLYPQIIFGMEGDTPSFLWLIQNGLGYRDRIDWGSWGGRYSRSLALVDWAGGIDTNHFVDSLENATGLDGQDYSTPQASVWRWRTAYQDDFAARMQWTMTSNFSKVGHPPVLNINGQQGPDPLIIQVKSNETYTFDAGLTLDPDYPTDNSRLEFQWVLYREATIFEANMSLKALQPPVGSNGILDINDAGFTNATLGIKVQVTVPQPMLNTYTGTYPGFHILLQVTNRAGQYPIRRYMRVICEYDI